MEKSISSKTRRDIARLINCFNRYNFSLIFDSGQLEKFVHVESNTFHINEIFFHIKNSGMRAKPKVMDIEVSFDLNYTLTEPISSTYDMFSSYVFNLRIKGTDSNSKDFNFFCWHLDRDPSTNVNLVHPYYHLHAGGKEIGDRDVGELLMIGSPRIPHPPMDIILAIHFIILNFINFKDKKYEVQKKIMKDSDYIDIIQNAQKRVLDPYFDGFRQKHDIFNEKNLFPLYI